MLGLENVYIRRFRRSDLSQVRDLLVEGFVTSEGSVTVVAQRRALLKPPSLLSYLIAGYGVTILSRGLNALTTGLGALLCAAGIVLFLAARDAQSMRTFCELAFVSDFGDIEKHYSEPGALFVAAIRGNTEMEEVVGYVGFEYKHGEESAVVRRMVVSAKNRRRGVALLLVDAVTDYSRTLDPALKYIDLKTSEYQPGAQRLYKRLGWEVTGTETHGNWLFTRTLTHFRRPV